MSTNSAEQHEAEETSKVMDTGDFMEVPKSEQLAYDPVTPDEVNEDEFKTDFSDVPDGEHVELSTAGLDD